jgi:aminopeptidase C
LTHSTLLIGWGYDEEKKMKYWLVRNSYGPGYGESGNLRVRRGMNDFGCEAELAAFKPILLQ